MISSQKDTFGKDGRMKECYVKSNPENQGVKKCPLLCFDRNKRKKGGVKVG
jgi:hypothetical protein